jgi:hypothetical protein
LGERLASGGYCYIGGYIGGSGWYRAHHDMHLAQQDAQAVDLIAVRLETRGDVFIEQLLHAEQALRHLLILLGQRLVLFA